MKNRIFALAMALVLLFSLAACGERKANADTKSITVTVTHGDGSAKDFAVSTDKEMLGEALEAEGLIAGEVSTYGLFVQTVDGETADADNEEWWCLTKGGESVNTGVDSVPVEDGAAYEWTLTVGY